MICHVITAAASAVIIIYLALYQFHPEVVNMWKLYGASAVPL